MEMYMKCYSKNEILKQNLGDLVEKKLALRNYATMLFLLTHSIEIMRMKFNFFQCSNVFISKINSSLLLNFNDPRNSSANWINLFD